MHEIRDLWAQSGWVGGGLTAISLLLWTAVWLRLGVLRSGVVEAFARRMASSSGPLGPARRSALLHRAQEELEAWQSPIRVCVLVAPLLGLLGTVGGMVELFDSLHGGAVVKEGSVAGGISQALVTTQLGLIIGVPGLVASRLLDRRQIRLQARLQILATPTAIPDGVTEARG